jgi:hypothetical protein
MVGNRADIAWPRHSPINAIANNALSEHSGFGPGRLNKGAILSQVSSTTKYIHRQKSLKSFIIRASSCVLSFFSSYSSITLEDILSIN